MGFSRIVTFPLRHPRILLVEQQVPLGLIVLWNNYLCNFTSHGSAEVGSDEVGKAEVEVV
jgi:hypothetical protein